MSRSLRHLRMPVMLAIPVVMVLAACSSPANPTTVASVTPVGSPGDPLGVFPGVQGWSYRLEPGTVPGFVRGVEETLGPGIETEIGLAAVASRGDDQVSLIAFGFPGTDDTEGVDYFARVLDDMEDGFQAGSQRGLGGDAYLMTADGRTTVLAPFVRSPAGHLVFLFALGPEGPTEELAGAILDAGG